MKLPIVLDKTKQWLEQAKKPPWIIWGFASCPSNLVGAAHRRPRTRMARPYQWLKILFCMSFLLFITLPKGMHTPLIFALDEHGQALHIYPTNTVTDIISIGKTSDHATYARAAKSISTGTFSEAEQWIIELFPPGLIVIEIVCLKLFGVNCPIVLLLIIITCGAWSFVLVTIQ